MAPAGGAGARRQTRSHWPPARISLGARTEARPLLAPPTATLLATALPSRQGREILTILAAPPRLPVAACCANPLSYSCCGGFGQRSPQPPSLQQLAGSTRASLRALSKSRGSVDDPERAISSGVVVGLREVWRPELGGGSAAPGATGSPSHPPLPRLAQRRRRQAMVLLPSRRHRRCPGRRSSRRRCF